MSCSTIINRTQFLPACGLLFVLAVSGCVAQKTKPAISEVRADIAQLQENVEVARTSLLDWQSAEQAADVQASQQIAQVQRSLTELHSAVNRQCETPKPQTSQDSCAQQRQVVVNDDDKMVLGEVERVWIDPPGLHMLARIDTGAASSSLNATDITPFERDGDNWVRFMLTNEDDQVTIERPVTKYVRVFQQADKKGSRRPVVDLHLILGDIKATFSFTLADRSHLEHNMILGRNFLTDMALVDVSKQFVQPHFQPEQ